MGASYAWREDVRAATDSKTTARDDALIDRALQAGTEAVDGLCHRDFVPTVATRSFDWPNSQYARPWRLWLDANELISVDTLTAGGVAIAADDFFLEPQAYGPPFDHIEIDLDSSASFGGGDTHQRDISVLGLFGYRNAEAPAGALESAIADATTITVDVTDGALVGVGALLRCESERMVVTGRAMLDTATNLGATGLTAQSSDTLLDADEGAVGEVLLIDSERLLVVDVAGTDRIVRRAWDGSVLATHSPGADIYASRRLTAERGAHGTTAAAHADTTSLVTWQPPALVRELCTAEAIAELNQHGAGWARTAGSGDNEREVSERGLVGLRMRCRIAHGRQARTRAV